MKKKNDKRGRKKQPVSIFDQYKKSANRLDRTFVDLVAAVKTMHNGGIYSQRFGRAIGRVRLLLKNYEVARKDQNNIVNKIHKSKTCEA